MNIKILNKAATILYNSKIDLKRINNLPLDCKPRNKKEDISTIENIDDSNKEKLSLEGSFNLLLLLGVIASVLLSGFWRPNIYFSILVNKFPKLTN